MAYLFGFPNNRSIKTDEKVAEVLENGGSSVIVHTPMKPLHLLVDDLLPIGNTKSKQLRKTFWDDWHPVLL